jgi:hypothetical protein
VIAKNGTYTSNKGFVLLDVVSLYPTAMVKFDHPYGKGKEVGYIDWNKLGIYEVELDGSQMSLYQVENYPEMIPFRDNTKLEYSFRETWKGVYNTYDLKNAIEAGYKIKVIRGIEYPFKAKIFNTFVTKFFKLKKENTGSIRIVGKIGLNAAGYGKFVQKPIDEDVIIVTKGSMQEKLENMPQNPKGFVKMGGNLIPMPNFYEIDEEWDKMVIEREGTVHYPTQNGSFILSAARRYMYKIINNIKQECPKAKVLYSDTDSILMNADHITNEVINKYVGTELGQLSDEVNKISGLRPHTVIIAGPKMYCLIYTDPETGVDQEYARFKGIPSRYLSSEIFRHIIKDKDNIAKVEMEIIRKNIVRLDMVNQIKSVHQIWKN